MGEGTESSISYIDLDDGERKHCRTGICRYITRKKALLIGGVVALVVAGLLAMLYVYTREGPKGFDVTSPTFSALLGPVCIMAAVVLVIVACCIQDRWKKYQQKLEEAKAEIVPNSNGHMQADAIANDHASYQAHEYGKPESTETV